MAGFAAGHLVGQLAGAVGRPVVDDQDVSLWDGLQDGVGDGADVLALVVRRDDDPDVWAGERHRLPCCTGGSRPRIPPGSPTLLGGSRSPGPARTPPAARGRCARRTHENARRNQFDQTAVSRVPAASTSANKGSENSSLKRRTALRPLPGLPPSPLHSDFRGSRSAFQFRNPCGSLDLPVDRYTVSVETAESVMISLAPPGKRTIGSGRRHRKGLIHVFRKPWPPFGELSTRCQHG